MSRFDKFEKTYEDAVESIKMYLENEDEATRHLINWLFNTKHNPYSIFCEESYASMMSTAEGFSGLCSAIHHALVDDGDISFPVVEDQPQIAFVWQHEKDIEKYVVKAYDPVCISMRERWGLPTVKTLTWLNDVYQFTKAFDKYQEDWRIQCEERKERRNVLP